MICDGCGHDNPVSAHFCAQCGTRLHRRPAPAAARRWAPPQKFCSECGTPAAPPPGAPAPPDAALAGSEGERKQVTVLFCDIVDSTGLAERLGAEAMHALLDRFFELALGEVHRYGGTINKFLGDGFMALIGRAGKPTRTTHGGRCWPRSACGGCSARSLTRVAGPRRRRSRPGWD